MVVTMKTAQEALFEKIEETLMRYPNMKCVIQRIEKIEDVMDDQAGDWDDDEELYEKLMEEWDELILAYDMFQKLKTFEEWKELGIHVTKGEKSRIRLGGKAVFHSTQTRGGYYDRNNKKWFTPINRYNKWESPEDDDFAGEMDYDLGGIGYYQDEGFWG
jgi:hypothetical protein